MKASEMVRRLKGLINSGGDWLIASEEGDEIKDLLPNYTTGRIDLLTEELKYERDNRDRYR